MADRKSSFRLAQTVALIQFCVASLTLVGLVFGDALADWVIPYVVVAWGFSGVCLFSAWLLSLRIKLRQLFERPPLAWGIVIFLIGFWVWGLWGTAIQFLPPLEFYLPFVLLWPWLTIGFFFAISDSRQHKTSGLVKLIGQGVVSLVLIALMLEILLHLFVNQLPQELIDRAPLLAQSAERRGNSLMMPPQVPVRNYRWAGKRSSYTLYSDDGDLFRLTCLAAPKSPEALYSIDIQYSEYGFRETTSGPTDLVVLGDSFTFAAWTMEPYWMNIYPNVLAMGITGSGSLEQNLLLEAYGAERSPKVVMMAFFEGNDMQDTWKMAKAITRYQQENPLKLSFLERHHHFRPLRFLSAYGAALWMIDESPLLQETVYGECPYPVQDVYGHDLAFFDAYVSMGTIDTDTLRHSPVYTETAEAIRSAAEQAHAMDATFVLMFIPTKFHAHWQGIVEAGLLPELSPYFNAFTVTSAGIVEDESVTTPEQIAALLEANIDNQRTLLTELAQEEGFLFLDLTPIFYQAISEGQAIYSYGDTHWSLGGHDYVRDVLRDFLGQHGLLENAD